MPFASQNHSVLIHNRNLSYRAATVLKLYPPVIGSYPDLSKLLFSPLAPGITRCFGSILWQDLLVSSCIRRTHWNLIYDSLTRLSLMPQPFNNIQTFHKWCWIPQVKPFSWHLCTFAYSFKLIHLHTYIWEIYFSFTLIRRKRRWGSAPASLISWEGDLDNEITFAGLLLLHFHANKCFTI